MFSIFSAETYPEETLSWIQRPVAVVADFSRQCSDQFGMTVADILW